MPRKKSNPEGRIVLDAAVGLCAWALTHEVMIVLEQRGLLRRKDTARILLGSINAIEELAKSTAWHPAFEVALEMLREQAAAWQRLKG